MQKKICDICQKNDASTCYKIKRSTRGMLVNTPYGIKWDNSIWKAYEKISVCQICAENIIGAIHKNTAKKIM